jgi:hypothetical protein
MTTRELAKHIYNYAQTCKNDKPKGHDWTENDDNQSINYISHLIELHFEPQTHLGSKGFLSTSSDKRSEFGC